MHVGIDEHICQEYKSTQPVRNDVVQCRGRSAWVDGLDDWEDCRRGCTHLLEDLINAQSDQIAMVAFFCASVSGTSVSIREASMCANLLGVQDERCI